MTEDTIFRLYSMSKPITSVAAMMLVEDGKLALDDPVSKYIPAFADVKVGVEKHGRERQARAGARAAQPPDHDRRPAAPHLRHHLRLLRRQRGAQALCRVPICSTAISTMPSSSSGIAKLPLAEQPGTLWDYGHSTDVLGRVIEVVSGKSLFQFEKERLLDPLGMSDTALLSSPMPRKRPRIAEPMPSDRFDQPDRGHQRSAAAAALGIRRRRHGRHHRRLCAVCADAAERRHARRQALSQARDGRADDVGPYRPGDRISRATSSIFPARPAASASALPCAPSVPPNTSWPLGEYRWDGVGGTFFFIDPKDDMFAIFMMQTPSQRGRIRMRS